MKVDVDMLAGSQEAMDAKHKALCSMLLDMSHMVAKRNYDDQDLDEYAERLEDLIDGDDDQEEQYE